MAEVGLKAYDPEWADGALPILNSISPARTEMFDLIKITPFMPILLASERLENGVGMANDTAKEVHQTARELFLKLVSMASRSTTASSIRRSLRSARTQMDACIA